MIYSIKEINPKSKKPWTWINKNKVIDKPKINLKYLDIPNYFKNS